VACVTPFGGQTWPLTVSFEALARSFSPGVVRGYG